jgi:prophage regulatory protein
MPLKLIRKPEVLSRHCCKTTCLYKQIADGVFTPPVKINDVSSAWPEYESDAILAARIAGRSRVELRALVRELIADRAKLPGLGASSCVASRNRAKA